MNDSRFSPSVELVLRDVGWYPGREVPESLLREWYAFRWESEVGYCYAHSIALNVLREFGDLSITQAYGSSPAPWFREAFHINPLSAIGIDDYNWLFNEWHVGDILFPLGWLGEDQDQILAIGSRGGVYGLGDALVIYGNMFDEALENLILGKKTREIYVENFDKKAEEAGQVRIAIRKLFGLPE